MEKKAGSIYAKISLGDPRVRLVNKYINVDLIKSPMQAGKNNGLKILDFM